MMGESDNDSWSVVDDADILGDRSPEVQAVEGQGIDSTGRSEASSRPVAPKAEEGSRGIDSPPRPVKLEAVESSSPSPRWNFRAARDFSTQPRESQPESSSSPLQQASNESSQPLLPLPAVCDTSEGEQTIEALPEALRSPFDSSLPGDHLTSDSPFDSDDLDDNMSEASSDSHIMVTHPDEEDSAERRWRLAEQRGNDIRRAQSIPSPRVQGTSSYLKVMVIGERGLGKTTFIQNLQAALQPDAPAAAQPEHSDGSDVYTLFEASPDLLSTQVVIDNGVLRCHYLLQDTPGLVYGQTNIRIPDHVSAQNAAYLALEQDPQRQVPMSAVKDPRVDACLFFINPNHLKDAEVAAMAHLAELVPIVPIIAKADTFTPTELEAFRQHVWQRLAEEEERLGRAVMWAPHRDAEGSEEAPQPPFAVIASRQSDLSVGRFWPVRDYSWGRCETLASANSDISLLKQLLFEEGFAGLKQGTEERYYRFRERQLRGQDRQAEPEVPDQASSAGVPRASNPARQSQGSRSRGNRSVGEGGGYRKLWKWGLLLLTTVISTAYLGKVAENRQLQQDLAAAQDMADLKDQVADQLELYIKIGLPQEAAELEEQCKADPDQGFHLPTAPNLKKGSTDLMLSTPQPQTPEASRAQYRVLVDAHPRQVQFQYEPPSAELHAQPEEENRYDYPTDGGGQLHYWPHEVKRGGHGQDFKFLSPLDETKIDLWDAKCETEGAELQDQTQGTESECQLVNEDWRMQRIQQPIFLGGGMHDAVDQEAPGFLSTIQDIILNLTNVVHEREESSGSNLPDSDNDTASTTTAARPATLGSPPVTTAVLPFTTAAKAAVATGTAASSTGLVLLHNKAQKAGTTLWSASTAVVAYTQQAGSSLHTASTAVAAYTQQAVHGMHRASHHAGVVLYNGAQQSSAAVVHCIRQAHAAVAHAAQSTASAVSEFGGDVARAGHTLACKTPVALGRLQADVSWAGRSMADALGHAGSTVQHSVTHALHQIVYTAGHARKRAKHVVKKGMGKLKKPKVGKAAQRFLRIVAQVGVLGAAL